MNQVWRSVAVFTVSCAVSAALLGLVGESRVGRRPMEAAASSSAEHELSKLRILHEALAPVAESYVEPSRVDAERMFVSALEAVEALVPEVMFHREAGRLSVHVGDYRDTLEIPRLVDLRDLQRELRTVATLLEQHLRPEDVPTDDPEIDPFALVEFAMGNGMLATLDPHSALLPPEASREMDTDNRGEFGGLGINIELDDDQLLVSDALEGKPAALAGVRPGDRIRRINGQSTINLTIDEAVQLLRGRVGEPVTLELLGVGDAAPREVVVRRENIKFNEVEGYVLRGALGYVRVPSFHATVHHDLLTVLQRLERDTGGLQGLVLDLRDNPGGYLNQAIAVADTFLTDGEIVSTRGPYDRRPSPERAQATGVEASWPMIVLVNANSASASEIVAGALRNNQRAVIVGERTFGKGSVQNLHPLPYDSKLKITIAHYLTPGEHSIQSIGIPADVELVPAQFGSHRLRPGDDHEVPDAGLFTRERIKREADLDEHLERREAVDEQPMYRIVYPQPWPDPHDRGLPTYGPPRPERDPELTFATSLLEVAPSAARGDILAAAAPLVQRVRAADDARIVSAFDALGVDWSDGPTPAATALDVRLQLGEHGVLVAGEEATVEVAVTNQGSAPVHRLAAVLSDHEALEGLEFFLGRLAPGETRSWSRKVRLDHGWPTEVGTVTVRLRDEDGRELVRTAARVDVQGHERPQIGWAWQVESPSDGSIDVGDVLRVRLDVRNTGSGASLGATGRIRNRAGRALDVLTGTLQAGTMVDAAGRPCRVLEPGWEAGRIVGDARADDPRVVGRVPPKWAEGCRRELAPGATWSGSFEIEVIEPLEGGYRLDLSLEDTASYDHGAIVREGFLRYYRNEEPIRFALGVPTPGVPWREAPRIDLTLVPEHEVHGQQVTLSGRVSDLDGVDHVLVFSDTDKVFYEGTTPGDELPTIPFTANVALEPGLHTLTVLARDAKGFSTTVSHVVSRRPDTFRAEGP